MSRNSASSMFGGAGGRGSRASVSSLQGLRNAMSPESPQQPRDNGPSPVAPGDDSSTMKGLNNRLAGYMDKVDKLKKSNQDIEDQIEEILRNRAEPSGRDWDAIQKPLDDLRKQVHDLTMKNADLLLQADNNKLATDDFKNKLDTERAARRIIESDLAELRKIIDDTHISRLNIESDIESTKEEMVFMKKEHSEEVAALKEQIRNSIVNVEVDSPQSSLSETINKIRAEYERVAVKSRKEAEDWYKNKFENIKVEVAKNTESLQTGKVELTKLLKIKQSLEVDIQTRNNVLRSLEQSLKNTEDRYGRELSRLNRIIQQLETELSKVRDQVELQDEDYQELLNVKMQLEDEIKGYRELLEGTNASAVATCD